MTAVESRAACFSLSLTWCRPPFSFAFVFFPPTLGTRKWRTAWCTPEDFLNTAWPLIVIYEKRELSDGIVDNTSRLRTHQEAQEERERKSRSLTRTQRPAGLSVVWAMPMIFAVKGHSEQQLITTTTRCLFLRCYRPWRDVISWSYNPSFQISRAF